LRFNIKKYLHRYCNIKVLAKYRCANNHFLENLDTHREANGYTSDTSGSCNIFLIEYLLNLHGSIVQQLVLQEPHMWRQKTDWLIVEGFARVLRTIELSPLILTVPAFTIDVLLGNSNTPSFSYPIQICSL
jgi:hypothetical protein